MELASLDSVDWREKRRKTRLVPDYLEAIQRRAAWQAPAVPDYCPNREGARGSLALVASIAPSSGPCLP